MISNSQIFTSSVFGNGSGMTSAEQSERNTNTIEKVYQEYIISKFNNKVPLVPSNQVKAKD